MNEHVHENLEQNRPQPEPHRVEIFINHKPKPIVAGIHTVVDIKNLGGVPLADELEQVINGKLVPLPDDGSVKIKGGEKFISHVREGGSS